MMTPVKRVELLEDIMRFIAYCKSQDYRTLFEKKIKELNTLHAERLLAFEQTSSSPEEAERLHQLEQQNLTGARASLTQEHQLIDVIQQELCQLKDLQHLIRSPSTQGGSNNTLALINSIQSKTRKVNDLFDRYNRLYRVNESKLSTQSPEVTDVNSLFWIRASQLPSDLINKRETIDAWCKLKRVIEAKAMLKSDIQFALSHSHGDIAILSSPTFVESSDHATASGWRVLINREIARLQTIIHDINQSRELQILINE